MQYECPICMLSYDGAAYQPTVIGVCGHTICRECSTKIDRCPFCKKAFDQGNLHKNYALCSIIFSLPFLKIKEGRIKQPHEIQQENANYEIELRKTTLKCPDGHACMWYSIIDSCLRCKDSRTGWKCTKCAYEGCDLCMKTDFRRGCPNGHRLMWKNEKHRCQSCLTKCEVFHCTPCKFTICNVCLNRQYKRSSCPNNHKTAWSREKAKCNCCLMYNVGWQCELCTYNICQGCSANEKSPPANQRKLLDRRNLTFMH